MWKRSTVLFLCFLILLGSTALNALAAEPENAMPSAGEQHGSGEHVDLGKILPLWSTIPFVGILLSIALFPLIRPVFWHHHFPKVSAFWALLFAFPFLGAYSPNPLVSLLVFAIPVGPLVLIFATKAKSTLRYVAYAGFAVGLLLALILLKEHGGPAWHEILHIYVVDYIPFIILLWALFTVAGGLVISGTLRGSPLVNVLMLLIGTMLASWIGTTGAAMVLIRPLIRANNWRTHKVHVVVFFIFLVANVGGSLTPLGDPPLFLGFLHGVSFFWTFHLLPDMLFVSAVLLVGFFLLDSYYYRKEEPPKEDGEKEPIRIQGLYNLLLLGGVIGAVLMSGTVKLGEVNVFGVHQTLQNLFRDLILILMGVISLVITPKTLREKNEFSWEPIAEVAYLFAGIFMTIIPALAILRAGSEGHLAFLIEAVNTPRQFFWATGILSSFLDNAPTYLTFFSSAQGKLYPGMTEAQAVPYLMAGAGTVIENGVYMVDGVMQTGMVTVGKEVVSGMNYLVGIAAGAVFMGANTYIGNAPNFMVKSIAEEQGVPMPTFFGYMFKYSLPVLIPLFIISSLLFL